MKGSELKRLLRKSKCKKVGEYDGHERWYSPISGKEFPVTRHDSQEVAVGTVNRILKDAGLK